MMTFEACLCDSRPRTLGCSAFIFPRAIGNGTDAGGQAVPAKVPPQHLRRESVCG